MGSVMTEIPGFSINVAPRTKKTHNQIVTIRPKSGAPPFNKILPSAAYREFFKLAMKQAPLIKAGLRQHGVELPIRGELNVAALFYREANVGDSAGYYQALGDFLQEPRQRNGKETRSGAGVIEDDVQIRRWWGSDLLVDRKHPRIEVHITVLAERPTTREMFEEEVA